MFARPTRANGRGCGRLWKTPSPCGQPARLSTALCTRSARQAWVPRSCRFLSTIYPHISTKPTKIVPNRAFSGLFAERSAKFINKKANICLQTRRRDAPFGRPRGGRGKGPPRRRIFGKIFFRGQNPLTNFKNTVILFGYAERQARRSRGRFARTCALSSIG